MNLNLWAYGIYLIITFVVVIIVGRICYTNGNKFVLSLVPDDHELCTRINRLLLLGYYLMNLGFLAISLVLWDSILTVQQLFELITFRIGLVLISIALMHYFNLFWLTRYLKKLIKH